MAKSAQNAPESGNRGNQWQLKNVQSAKLILDSPFGLENLYVVRAGQRTTDESCKLTLID